jgi:hypothetical protein
LIVPLIFDWLIICLFRSIHYIAHLLVSKAFYSKYVPPPNPTTSPYILDNPKLFPFFKYAIGAIDGSHIPVHVRDQDAPRYRNRKGWLSQNVLASCDWTPMFNYVLAGWEGSASDSHIFSDARNHGDFSFPQPWFFLADAGFANCDLLMCPYHAVRYHLKEQACANQR